MTPPFEMGRRSLIQRVLFLAGASAIPVGCSDLSGGPGSDFKFTSDQFELVAAFADTIIPRGGSVGALDAAVPQKFEGLMRDWASAERRTEILASLEAMTAAAKAVVGKPFTDLAPAERLSFLKQHEVEAMKPAPVQETKGGAANMGLVIHMDEGYAKSRELVIKLFYLSEEALTKELDYQHDPGGYTPSVPVTPDTRRSGGLGPF